MTRNDYREFSEKMFAKCPILFRNKTYIGVGEGWYPLIEELCVKIEEIAKTMEKPPAAAQIKEKFGGLRFYIDGEDFGVVDKLIANAEQASFSICEDCGEPGTRRSGSWIRTLCDKHAEDRIT